MTRLIVTGTDTGIGKTVFSAALASALGATYWEPIQSGLEDGADADSVTSTAAKLIAARMTAASANMPSARDDCT